MDNYVDIETLNIFSKKQPHVRVCIHTTKRTKLSATDVEKFNQQYPPLEVSYTEVFHDRFMIIDDDRAYHIGASLKDAGKKCFAVSLLTDGGIIKDIIQRLTLETETT